MHFAFLLSLLFFTSAHAFSIWLRNSIPAPNTQFVVSWAHTLDTDPDQVKFTVQGQQNGSPQRTVWGPFWTGGGQTGGDVTLQSMDAGDTVVFASFTNDTLLASLAFTTGSSGGDVTTGGPSQSGGSASSTTTQNQSQGQGQGTTPPSNPSSSPSNSNASSNSNSQTGSTQTKSGSSSSVPSQTTNHTSSSSSSTTSSFLTTSTSESTPTPPGTPDANTTSNSASSNSNKLPTILGVVFGILGAVLFILIILLTCRRRRRRNAEELLADSLIINLNQNTRPSTMFASEVTTAFSSSVSDPKLPDEKLVERPLPSLPSPQTSPTTSSFPISPPFSEPEPAPAPNPQQLLEELNWWRSQFSSEWNGVSGGAPPVYTGSGVENRYGPTRPLPVPVPP